MKHSGVWHVRILGRDWLVVYVRKRCLEVCLFYFQNGQHLPGELTGKYRQTAENNGTYVTKKPLIRSHQIVPSKNCDTSKIPQQFGQNQATNLPSNLFSAPGECRSSVSLPLMQNQMQIVEENGYFRERPRTPPEKRYSATFGSRTPERGSVKARPSSYVFENVHADSYRSLRPKADLRRHYDVKVGPFPNPEFSRMYIQERFD